ncbi:MAG: hypothetical protein IKE60_17125 [Reyranella sp.]|jgi:hypothetical protein|uniref:hypothetical protein n=1 Tax=Reyranella sp. TaxID=1929291 RepID=UPI000961A366|nr:hypothetical protein [Reyranella sp.]MBN9539631.1 hypothetical protein [Alphaproteobacteria bacterium]MBR2816378.1 hypothetical protein [Reyranella sp.]OJU45094.1 MAG: hypothetical protein BGN99_30835 [Alphaproteobacteria bacterium 65-37]
MKTDTTKTDFDHWLAAQFAETGPFTLFILLIRIDQRDAVPLKSSYAHLIGAETSWTEMRRLLDSARTPWDGAAFFVGLGQAGGPLPDEAAARRLKDVEADVANDRLALNRGRFFDREGRQLRIDEVAA